MAPDLSSPGSTVRVSRHPGRSILATVRAIPWLLPVLILILAIVVFPAGFMVWTSTRTLSRNGVDKGPAGWDNYARLADFPSIGRVLANTAIWVVGVVGLTLLISLVLAQFLSKQFPGRTAVRVSLIIPWAASVVMTTVVFAYGLDPFYGIMNKLLVDVGILDAPYGFTRKALPAFVSSMGVAIFVSLPFTTYALLAGLQTVPEDTVNAALVDGASRWQTYRFVVLPLLRPAIAVATIINVINVFNSLPILQVMSGSIPGYDADTTTTLTFKYMGDLGTPAVASALSVVNFLFILLVIVAYLVILKPLRSVEES